MNDTDIYSIGCNEIVTENGGAVQKKSVQKNFITLLCPGPGEFWITSSMLELYTPEPTQREVDEFWKRIRKFKTQLQRRLKRCISVIRRR